jgi:hypothetical protein
MPTSQQAVRGDAEVAESGSDDSGEEEEKCRFTYQDKIRMVGEILGKRLDATARPGRNISMVLDEGAKTERLTLPPAEGFPAAFRKFNEELTGAEGSKRGASKPGEICGIGAFPPKPNVVMKAYDIANRPWQQSAPMPNRSLLGSTVCSAKEEPQVKANPAKFRQLETSVRECVAIASQLDWFLAAIKKEVQNQADNINEREPLDREDLHSLLDDFSPGERNPIESWSARSQELLDEKDSRLWASLQNVVGLIESAGRCSQDLAKLLIDGVGACTLMRRDSILALLSDALPKEWMLRLRGADVNGEKLFAEEDVKAAKEALESQTSAKVQERFLSQGRAEPQNRRRDNNNNNFNFNRRFRREPEQGKSSWNPPQNSKPAFRGRKRFGKK